MNSTKQIYDAKLDPRMQDYYLDADEMRERCLADGRVLPYRYVHGGIRELSIKFIFCFPPKEEYKGRFFQYLSPFPGPDEELASLDKTGEDDKIAFCLLHGAYYVESNMGSAFMFGAKSDSTMCFKASAAAAEISRKVAMDYYGCGRPYDICLIGAWLSTVMLFVCPAGWGDGAKLAWVAIWYTLANAVFYTFLNAGEGVFMLRAFNKDQIVKLNTSGSIATSLLGFTCGIFVPQMVSNAGDNPAEWAKMAITLAIPLCLIGLCRMLFVKEHNDTVEVVEEKVKTELKDILQMLGKNKYLVITSVILLISNTISNMGVTTYYFDKVLGDVGIASVFGAASALAVFALLFLPKLMKKYPLTKILLVGMLLSAGLNVVSFIFYNNIPILVICYVLGIFVTLPGVYAGRILLFDMAMFNEYLNLNRMEGSMASVQGFMKRAGSALGAFLLGVGLKVIGYDADATTLLPITFWGLRILMYVFPLVSALVQAILWSRYDLEKRMPAIKEEMDARKANVE